jgi:acyl-CoA synthetase (AMP-forming)/AMP-acid ligase II
VLGNMVCAVYGATIVVPAPAFDPGATLAALAAERCTAVYGVPTMFVGIGEIVAAWVVPRAGAALSPEAIQSYCKGQITHFKIPQHIAIVQALPRTVTGKVRKHVLKAQAIADLGLDDVAAIQTA